MERLEEKLAASEARVRALEEALKTIYDDPNNFLCDKAEQVCRAALGEHND